MSGKFFNFKVYFLFFLAILFLIKAFSVTAQIPEGKWPVVGEPPQTVEDRFVPDPTEYNVEIWVKDLIIPWELIFLSTEKALVTERVGEVRLIEKGVLQDKPYMVIDEVEPIGEGGLMGMAKHPDYPEQKYIYIMYTYRENRDVFSRVARYLDLDNTLEFDLIIADKIPASNVHNGGRIAFGPDGMLYVSTGDTWHSELAQDMESLAGKILRYTPKGNIPNDNPFPSSPIYSLGHRNTQGLAWHPESGILFSSEHGPTGEFGLYGRDIINVVRKGGNYGWPLVLGVAKVLPYLDPIIMWLKTTPPSGMTFWDNYLFVATLRSETLIRIHLEQFDESYQVKGIDRLFAEDWDTGTFGRLRDAVAGPDGALYILTNNYDGRGVPREGDDKIIRITKK